eukprot:6210216-Pleurochrysis_carterae.AAC.2
MERQHRNIKRERDAEAEASEYGTGGRGSVYSKNVRATVGKDKQNKSIRGSASSRGESIKQINEIDVHEEKARRLIEEGTGEENAHSNAQDSPERAHRKQQPV